MVTSLLLPAAILLQAASAPAQPPPDGDREAAKTWANTAKERFDAGDFQGAVDGIREAEKHARAPTLTRLSAQAHERLGKLLEAQRLYRTIVETQFAPDAPEAWVKAQTGARDELASITLRIPKLEITVAGPDISAASVTLNGAPLDPAEIGRPLAVDPGRKTIVVRAPGREPVSRTVEVREGASERVELRVPARAPAAAPSGPPPSRPDVPSGPAVPRVVSWAAVGLGAAGLIAGGITGGIVLGERGKLDASCNFDLRLCTEGSRASIDQLRLLADISTASFIAGGVGVAAGVVLLLLPGGASSRPGGAGRGARPAPGSAPTVGVTFSPSGVSVRGVF